MYVAFKNKCGGTCTFLVRVKIEVVWGLGGRGIQEKDHHSDEGLYVNSVDVCTGEGTWDMTFSMNCIIISLRALYCPVRG